MKRDLGKYHRIGVLVIEAQIFWHKQIKQCDDQNFVNEVQIIPHINDYGFLVDDYEGWLKTTGVEDTEETRGWYNCPDGEQHDYIENHQEWWNNF